MAADGLSPEEVSLTGPVMGDNAGLVVVIGSAHLKLVGVSIVPVPEDDDCKRTEALEVTSQCSLTLERCRVSGGSFVFPKASLTAVDTQFTSQRRPRRPPPLSPLRPRMWMATDKRMASSPSPCRACAA